MKRPSPLLLGFDVSSLIVFVAAGRATHESGTSIGEILDIAAPFLIAMVLGWVLARAWVRPIALRTGYVVLVSTLVIGMLLRRYAFDDGTALTFVLVATALLTALLIGWRVAIAVTRRSRDTESGVSGP